MKMTRKLISAVATVGMMSSSAFAQTHRPDGSHVYLLTQEGLPDGIAQPPSCLDAPNRSAFLPILLFAANLVLQEGLEALSRREARRLERFSNTYGGRVNLAQLQLGSPGDRVECLAVEQRSGGSMASLFVIELRPFTATTFVTRIVYAHVASSPVVTASGVNTMNATVLLGFSAIAPSCAGCVVDQSHVLGSPSFSVRNITLNQPIRACSSTGETGACQALGGESAILPRPPAGAPLTIAANVSEVSTRLAEAKIQNAIWERQRALLLAALNATVKSALE